MSFYNLSRKYFANTSGHFAVSTALIAIPLLFGVSISFDSHRVEHARTQLKSALDGAAVAAITNQIITTSERASYAENRFWSNIEKTNNIKFDVVDSGNERVELKAYIDVPTTFSGILGRDNVRVSETAATELVKGATVCMLALDKDSPRSFEVTEGATLDANCSIQVNSLHKNGAVVDMGGKAVAQSFCVAGGAYGNYSPYVNTECSPAEDPYETVSIPAPSRCINQDELNDKLNDWRSWRDAIENHEIEENERWHWHEEKAEYGTRPILKNFTYSPGIIAKVFSYKKKSSF